MKSGNGNTAVFLTAYNEAPIIGDVIDRIDRSYSVFVIDDGSTDGTAEVSKQKGATVISHPINLGQGYAGLTMFRVACQLDYKYIIHIDADGQHDPDEIPRFIRALESSDVDIAQGSRILGSSYRNAPIARKLFLSPLTHVLNSLTGYRLSDSMCGFHGFRVAALRRVADLFDYMLEPEYLTSEVWIKFAKAGLTVANIPITLSERKKGHSYKGLFRYACGVISTIIRATLETHKHQYREYRRPRTGQGGKRHES